MPSLQMTWIADSHSELVRANFPFHPPPFPSFTSPSPRRGKPADACAAPGAVGSSTKTSAALTHWKEDTIARIETFLGIDRKVSVSRNPWRALQG